MKKIPVIALMVVSLMFAGFAEAAKPKKRSRNANRVGAYGTASIGNTTFNGNHDQNEQDLVDFLNNQGLPVRGVTSDTDDSDIGYQLGFGFRFSRYFAAELGLAQYGELVSSARGELDAGQGFVPASLQFTFRAGGVAITGIGILPLNDKFEFYARAGGIFASSEREISSRLDGRPGGFSSAKGDSIEPFLGVGFTWHLGQVYSIRAEYQKLSDIGENARTGTEELDFASIGMVIRF
jgi:opacity protein-like surface antigen